MKEKTLEKFILEAWKAWENAYTPYSKFKVGTALITAKNKIYKGCNIEIPVFSLSLCAERVALINAITEGERNFKEMIIVTKNERPLLPCGACRQMLLEFSPNLIITSLNHKNNKITISLKELLPHPPIHNL
jgi:cytidine deaminase